MRNFIIKTLTSTAVGSFTIKTPAGFYYKNIVEKPQGFTGKIFREGGNVGDTCIRDLNVLLLKYFSLTSLQISFTGFNSGE